MHPPKIRAEALALVEAGMNDCEISRRLGIPRSTVRDWRRPTYTPRNGRPRLPLTCPRCWAAAKPMVVSKKDYSELLGFYLGDGCISDLPRTQRLRISLDLKHPGIIQAAQAVLTRCSPENPVYVVSVPDGGCVSVSVYSSHLSCLFPQHGPGRKHKRTIELEPWQERILEAEPWPFIKACIWTDGSAFINRTDIHRAKPYEYLSYEFTNMSDDIVELFVGACARVGVFTRATNGSGGIWRVRINRRASVDLMLEHVGRKA